MSKYSADIEIAVRGGQQLNQTIKTLNRLNNSINVVTRNAKLLEGKGFNVASIENYSRAVSKAERAVRKAAEGTNQERQAITQLVSAMELENKARERKNILIAQEVANRRRVIATANAGVGMQGPALPGYMQSGPRSPLRGSRGIPGSPAALAAGAGTPRGAGSRIGGAISGSIIGGAFPLLFGQGAGAAAGGAVGGLVGGLAGPGGSFAGSLLGTLLGDIASKGNQVKKLGEDIGFSAEQTRVLESAFKQAGAEFDKFEASVQNIRGLSLDIADQANAIRLVSTLTEKYGGQIDKVTNAFTSALESGKVTQATLNQLTSQGIPIQQALADKYKVSRSEILQMAKDGKISVQELADVLVDMGNKGVAATAKTKTGFDNLKAAAANLGAAFSALGTTIVTSLQGPLDWLSNRIASIIDAAARGVSRIADLLSGGKKAQASIQASGQAQQLTRNKFGLRALNPFDKEVSAFRNTQEADILRRLTGGKLGPSPSESRQIGRIEVPGQLPPSGGGGGGKSAADKAAEAAAREAARVAEVVRNQKFITNELGLQTKFAQLIFEAEQAGEPVRARQLQTVQELVLAGNETARLLEEEQNGTAQLAIARARQANAESIRSKGAREVLALQMEQQKTFDEIIATLDFEFQLQQATTEEVREQLRLENELRKLKGEGFTDAQFEEIKKRKQRLAAPKTEGQKVEERIGTLKDDLKELTSISNQVIQAADAIGSAFQQAFMGLVSGAMTGQQALAAFFQGVGDHFMDMASQMIAKLIEIYILETVLGFITGGLGGGFGGGGGGDFSGAFGSGGPTFNPGAFSGPSLMAEGGFVTGPTSAIIGEGGESEYVIPASKMSAAMQRYGSGARGSAVIPTSGGSSTEPASTGAAPGGAIDVRYTVERINSVDYVTADQFQQGMQQAAAQGAQRGEQRALRSLQQSTSVRSRVGIR